MLNFQCLSQLIQGGKMAQIALVTGASRGIGKATAGSTGAAGASRDCTAPRGEPGL